MTFCVLLVSKPACNGSGMRMKNGRDQMSPTRRSIQVIGDEELYRVLIEILTENPRLSNDRVFRLAMAKLGFMRLGSRIRKRLSQAVKKVRPSVLILDKSDYLGGQK